MRLYFQSKGDGPPLVILHGFLGSSDNWRNVSRRLSSRFKVITLDLRNHGHSPHDEAMSYAAMAGDVEDFYRQENIDASYLLGHSMGGKVAMQLATTHPQRVRKLVIVDIAPKPYPQSHNSLLAALRDLDLRNFRSFGEIDAALAPSIESPVIRQFLVKNVAREPDGSFHWRIHLQAIVRNYPELTKSIAPRRNFPGPVRFLRGGRSNYLQPEDLPAIQNVFPRAEMITIARAGHWVHSDAPEDFCSAVTDFLEGSPIAPALHPSREP